MNREGVRYTHLPTGLTAIVHDRRPYRRECSVRALTLLKAKLAKLREDPAWCEGCYPGRERVRSYHLSPRAGMPQHVRDHRTGVVTTIDAELFWPRFWPGDGALLDRVMLAGRRAKA
jgi:hypothetical protein